MSSEYMTAEEWGETLSTPGMPEHIFSRILASLRDREQQAEALAKSEARVKELEDQCEFLAGSLRYWVIRAKISSSGLAKENADGSCATTD